MNEKETIDLINNKVASGRPLFLHHRAIDGRAGTGGVSNCVSSLKIDELDGIEFDIQKTKDHKIIVRHDFAIEYEGSLVWVKELTLEQIRESLNEHDCPTLEHLLKNIKDTDKIIDIELKQADIAKEVIDLLHKYNLYKNTVFTTLYPEVYQEIKSIDPDVAIFFGYPRDRGKNLSNRRYMQPIITLYIAILKAITPNNLQKIYNLAENPFYTFYNKMVSSSLVKNLHKDGKLCGGAIMSLRNLDHEKETLESTKKLLEQKVDIIIVDYPEVIEQIYETKN